MRNIATKIDGNTLPAAAFNSDQDELENAVLSSDQTLDPDAGPDTDLNMLGKAMAAYGNAANVYQDSGAADAYVLAISSNLKPVTKYYDNMMIVFKAGNSNTGASTVNVNTLGVKSITFPDGTALGAGTVTINKYTAAIYSLSNDRFEIAFTLPTGQTVQIAHTQSGSLQDFEASSNIIPYDDTIPQITEGDELYTQAITPKSATNKLLIEAVINFASDASTENFVLALFQDTTTDALDAVAKYVNTTNKPAQIILRYEMTAGVIIATTFKLRAGVQTAGVGKGFVINGDTGTPQRRLGGVMISSLRITEIQA